MRFLLVPLGWLTAACGGLERYPEPVDPGVAPRAAVDRFGSYGQMFNRDAPLFNPAVTAGNIPGPNEPYDMDAMFTARGLGPNGDLVVYYALDMTPPLPARAYVVVDEAGEPFADQLPVVETLPGDEGYNDYVWIHEVWVGDDYPANGFRSVAAITAAADKGTAVVKPTREVSNWAMVPWDTTATRRYDGIATSGWRAWRDGEVSSYLKFESLMLTEGDAVPQSTVIVIFADGMSPNEGFLTEPGSQQTHNVFQTVPGDERYSSLWIHRSGDPQGFDTVHDWDSAVSNTVALLPGVLVNCPIVD